MTIVDYDLKIYYSGNFYVSGMCTRWDVQDYGIVIQTWLKKQPLKSLRDNIRPGAVKEVNRVVYSPKYYDSTWRKFNTLRLQPVEDTNLYYMRGPEKILYPKNISSSPIRGNSGWLDVKIEGNISGSSL